MEHIISELLAYGLRKRILHPENEIYARNRLLHLLDLDEWNEAHASVRGMELPEILTEMIDYAIKANIISDTQSSRDQFDSMIMDALMPLPHEVIHTFQAYAQTDSKAATDYFYHLSCASNYIRMDRLKKDVKWKCDTPYGTMDITINMAKPEKDPKDIAKAKTMRASGYPKCALCKENEGYYGNHNQAARQNHRIIPILLQNERYFLQYSPYSYYNEHCIVFNEIHKPMKIDHDTFLYLLDFVHQYPHYFIGSNADLPIVGGSILAHDHFQGGCYRFAMEDAICMDEYHSQAYKGITYSRLYWPLSVIRIKGDNREEMAHFAAKVLQLWKNYEDPSLQLSSHTGKIPHNTITPIARMRDGVYELDLVLRNNRTSEERPFGIFHPAPKWHHIKKENIGLIEVMGLAVLPSRLKQELDEIANALQHSEMLKDHLQIHKPWVEELKQRYGDEADQAWDAIIHHEVGMIFSHVLEDAGVFKQEEAGQAGFVRFLQTME